MHLDEKNDEQKNHMEWTKKTNHPVYIPEKTGKKRKETPCNAYFLSKPFSLFIAFLEWWQKPHNAFYTLRRLNADAETWIMVDGK